MADLVLGLTMWIFGIATGLLTGITIEYQFNLIEKMRKRQDDDHKSTGTPKDEWPTGPYISVSGEPSMPKFYAIVCPSCCSTAFDENKERVIKKWNTRARVSDGVAATTAMTEFLDASVAVWREIDRLSTLPEGYKGLPPDTDLRIRERVAWEKYKAMLDAAPAPIAAPVKEHKRHVLSGCNEFLCLPEVNPHHYEIVPDAAPQDERPRKVFDAGFSSQSPAINAAEEIREWLGITGLVDGNGIKEVAAIIQKHYEPETTSKAED